MDSFAADNRVSISLPSTRVDAVRPEIMQQIARVRKTGFTLAPEGGSERMRQVINKGLTEEDILKACRQVFEAGWDSIKLYFMIGLPSETDEDVLAIAELAKKIKTLPEAKGRALTVSASTFIPKPHTPFQWAEQISADEAYRRQEILKTELRKIGVKFRYQRTFPSVLEGLLARGGTELAEVIVDAYQRGARFEAWDEHRREDIWRDVLEHHEIDLGVAFRERSISEKLPWDCTTGTVSRSFLLKEWQQARQGKQTQSCLHSNCSNCGVCGGELGNIRFPILEEVPPRPAPSPERQVVKQRIRLKFAKVGPLALVSHLELAGLFQRCCRRARLPIAYSEGFHPLPRVVFGPPLQLGIASLAEYVDLYLIEQTSPQGLISSLQALLPKGMSIEDAQEIDLSAPSISESVRVQRFEIMSDMSFLGFSDPNRLGEYFTDKAAIDDLIVSSYLETLIERDAKVSHQKRGKRRKVKKAKSFLLREHLSNLEFYPSVENSEVKAFFDLKFQPQIASPKPFEIAKLLTSRTPKDYWLLKTRMELDPQVGKDQALI
jgi:radical SAM-linked protein